MTFILAYAAIMFGLPMAAIIWAAIDSERP